MEASKSRTGSPEKTESKDTKGIFAKKRRQTFADSSSVLDLNKILNKIAEKESNNKDESNVLDESVISIDI